MVSIATRVWEKRSQFFPFNTERQASRGYTEVQILKTVETDPLSWTFWNILICSCPNSEKKNNKKKKQKKKTKKQKQQQPEMDITL